MQHQTQTPVQLEVGHPSRPLIGRAVLGSVLLGVVFLAVTWITKETQHYYLHSPWQDDPYDAVVSFSIFFVPLLVGLCVVRLPLCRQDAVLPVRRATDLLHASRVVVGVAVVTLLSEWTSVALRAERTHWTGITALLISLLAGLTMLTLVVGWNLRRAVHALGQWPATPSPDWLADALTLGEGVAVRLGSRRDDALRTLGWIEHHLVRPIRRHPLRSAATLAAAFGGAVASLQALRDGVAWSALILVGVAGCGMFAFLTIVGSHLCLVGPRGPGSRGLTAVLLTCASVPLVLAFRSSLWWMVGLSDKDVGPYQLTVLLLGVPCAIGVLAFASGPAVRAVFRRSRFCG